MRRESCSVREALAGVWGFSRARGKTRSGCWTLWHASTESSTPCARRFRFWFSTLSPRRSGAWRTTWTGIRRAGSWNNSSIGMRRRCSAWFSLQIRHRLCTKPRLPGAANTRDVTPRREAPPRTAGGGRCATCPTNSAPRTGCAVLQPLNLFPCYQCTAATLAHVPPPPRGCTVACGRVVAGVVPVVVCRTFVASVKNIVDARRRHFCYRPDDLRSRSWRVRTSCDARCSPVLCSCAGV